MSNFNIEQLGQNETCINDWMKLFSSCFHLRPEYTSTWAKWYNLSDYVKNKIYVVKDNDNIIASYGLFPLRIIYNSQEYQSYLANNGMTHPNYNGKGLFTKLGSYIMNNIRTEDVILLGIPNDNAIPGHRKVGWQELPNIPFFETTILKNKNLTNVYECITSFTKEDDVRIDSFFKKYDFYIYKDSNYLNWRFVNRPNIKYLIYKSVPFNSYIVLKHFCYRNENKLHIVDYGYDNICDFVDSIKLAINVAYELDASLVNIWCYNTQEQNVLLSNDFNKSDMSSRLILHSDINFLNCDKSNWHITLGDNDVY